MTADSTEQSEAERMVEEAEELALVEQLKQQHRAASAVVKIGPPDQGESAHEAAGALPALREQASDPKDGPGYGPGFEGVEAEIERDGWGRPLVLQPDGGWEAYTRASTFSKALDDSTGLTNWKMRKVAEGLVSSDPLRLSFARVLLKKGDDQTEELNRLCQAAMELAGAGIGAQQGTDLHEITQVIDEGGEPAGVPIQYLPGIAAYVKITAWFRFVSTENFGVWDELKLGGSWDRIAMFKMPEDADAPDEPWPFPFPPSEVEGQFFIWDYKTSKDSSLQYSWLSWACQLAIYANCLRYVPGVPFERSRIPLLPAEMASAGMEVSKLQAIVCHQAATGDSATLYFVNIEAGAKAVRLAGTVRHFRHNRRKLKTPLLEVKPAGIEETITQATERSQLRALWSDDLPARTKRMITEKAASLPDDRPQPALEGKIVNR